MRYKHIQVHRGPDSVGARLSGIGLTQLKQLEVQQELRLALAEFKCLFFAPQDGPLGTADEERARTLYSDLLDAHCVDVNARGGGVTQVIGQPAGEPVPCWVNVDWVYEALSPGLRAGLAGSQVAALSSTEIQAILEPLGECMKQREVQVWHIWAPHEMAIWENPPLLWTYRGEEACFRHTGFTKPRDQPTEGNDVTNLAGLLAML